jgi:hypothetical protein
MFVAGRAAVWSVITNGETVVAGGRHQKRLAIEARYKAVMANLTGV